MTRRRILRALGLAGLAVAASFGLFWAFVGLSIRSVMDGLDPLVDGHVVGPATTVVDGYVASFVLDAADGRAVLVDAGPDETAAPILAALRARGRGPDDVVAILLTHGHADHRGGTSAFPRARIYAHARELPLLRGEVRARGLVPWWSGRAEPLEVTAVEDGETVEIGGLRARALHVPGHTAGSVAWLVGETLFIGDAARTTRERTLGAPPWIFSDDVPEGRRSLVALAERLTADGANVSHIVPSHSAPLDGPSLADFAARTGLE